MSQHFPPYNNSSNNIKAEVDLSNYATKDDVKNITHIDVSSYATKTNLTALKTEIDKIDSDKLKTVPDELAKLSNVVKNEVVKKTDFSADNYVKKIKFSGNINYLDDKIDKVEKKIPDVSSLETKRNVTTLIKNLNDRIDNECKSSSFDTTITTTTSKISTWKLTGIFSGNMIAVGNAKENLPAFKNDGRMNVYLSGNHFQQNVAGIPNSSNVINIYCVYKLDQIASNRDDTFTVQNALFGAMQITKNADTSKYDYKRYGIWFDEGGQFGHTITGGDSAHTTNARNVSIFGADMSFSTHANNRANNIYVMGERFIQGINNTTIYAEKKF